MPFELPEISNKPFPEPDDSWIDITEVHRRIDDAAVAKQKGGKDNNTFDTKEEESKRKRKGKSGDKSADDDKENKDKEDKGNEDDKEGGIRWAAGFASLPAHANDLSEFFLASMIERVPNSWDLYVTTFLLQHDMLGIDSMNR